jgi:PhnB protein
MNKTINPIPAGYERLTAYLIVRGAAEAIEFYKKAFGAVERFRMTAPDGKTIGHAELQIGPSILMLADECPEAMSRSPNTLNGTTFCLVHYVEDVDAAFSRAVEAGATVVRPLENKSYGDRIGMLVDPFGHQWALMAHIEDVTPEEMEKRATTEHAATPSK